jgi:hypothetical protein
MLLEIPAVSYKKVQAGDTWKSLALSCLGSEERYVLLAQLNGEQPWAPPELGQIILIPYNLSWVASGNESLSTLAYRFLGSTKYAFQLVTYNNLEEGEIKRGSTLLLPLSDLPLTQEGKDRAEAAAQELGAKAHADHFRNQKDSSVETKLLADDVRGGRYVAAVARGNELLATAKLTHSGRAHVLFLLLESYVALDARGLARTTCEAWRALAPQEELDPLLISPKILRVCEKPVESAPKSTPVSRDSPSGSEEQ